MITLTDHATRRCSVSCSFFLLFGFLFIELICFFVVVLCSGARSFQINWMIFQTDDDVILFVHFFHRDFRVTVFSVWQSGTSKTTVFSVRLFCPCRLKVQHISYRRDNDTLLESTKFSQYNKPKTTAWKKTNQRRKTRWKKEWERSYTQSLPSHHHHLDLDPNKIYLISKFFLALSPHTPINLIIGRYLFAYQISNFCCFFLFSFTICLFLIVFLFVVFWFSFLCAEFFYLFLLFFSLSDSIQQLYNIHNSGIAREIQNY